MTKYDNIIYDIKGSDRMALGSVKVTAKNLDKRKKRLKYLKRIVIILFILILLIFFVLMVIYKGGSFTVTLDPNFSLDSGLVMYDSLATKDLKNKLYADELEFMDNISVNWLPNDIDTIDAAHNGENYIAYTFYLENQGTEVINYWYQVNILDVIKNVDEAIRIMIYQNGNRVIYAKKNQLTGKEEDNTKAFYNNLIPVLEERKNFKPGDIDKYTIVIYLEGDDPDCVDAIIGGEIKMNMEITEEHILENGKKKEK